MNTIRRSLLILLSISFSILSVAQENNKIQTVKITSSLSEIIFKESEYLSSVVVSAGNDGILMIDNGSKESYPDLTASLKTISDKSIKYIILT